MLRIDESGLTSIHGRDPKPAFCIFEYVYFARPDSMLEDQLVIGVRERLGIMLAKESPVSADIVVAVPDSSVPAGIGYAKQIGLPFVEGIAKNRYVHRTFIQPTQTLRKLGVSMKFTPIQERLQGKRVVLVDDSIVRGNTIENLVMMLRNGGATEVHVRISSPPVRSPCFMGIDMSTPDQMVAYQKSVEDICKIIGNLG
jgi:amidophosphoribosyltransferase